MSWTRALAPAPAIVPSSNARAFLEAFGVGKAVMDYGRGETIFRQGEPGCDVLYIQSGGVKLSVDSTTRDRVVVGTLGPGDFFGEGCLANQPLRMSTATAITPAVIRTISRRKMRTLLHTHPALCDWFIFSMLSRTLRVEDDLAAQLFKTNDKRGTP